MAILPRPPAPMLRSGQGHREDAQRTSRHQDSEEQQGHPLQTDSDYNKHLQLKLQVCKGWVGGKREKDKQTKTHMYRKRRVKETYQMNMAVNVRVWGKGEEEGDRQEKGRQPDKA